MDELEDAQLLHLLEVVGDGVGFLGVVFVEEDADFHAAFVGADEGLGEGRHVEVEEAGVEGGFGGVDEGDDGFFHGRRGAEEEVDGGAAEGAAEEGVVEEGIDGDVEFAGERKARREEKETQDDGKNGKQKRQIFENWTKGANKGAFQAASPLSIFFHFFRKKERGEEWPGCPKGFHCSGRFVHPVCCFCFHFRWVIPGWLLLRRPCGA